MGQQTPANGKRVPAAHPRPLVQIGIVLLLLYGFLLSISLMGSAFKLFGQRFAEALIAGCTNPLAGLFIGMLATGLIQSSSTVTSLTVGFVGGGVLPIGFAIPILMGANIGTTITNLLVSFGFVTRREDFRRAFAGALVHDFFNLCSVAVLFPIEMRFHIIQRSAEALGRLFGSAGGAAFAGPVQIAIQPVCRALIRLLTGTFRLPAAAAGSVLLASAVCLLVASLVFLVRTLRAVVVHRAERVVHRYLFRNDLTAFALGICLTVLVQSSSVTTSIMIPLVGAGVVTLRRCFPYTLGANIGTTCTALLASLATVYAGEGGTHGITIAFAHLLFNLFGILIFYPLRVVPITAAVKLSNLAAESKRWAVLFVLGLFFGLPLLVILLTR